MNKLCHDNWFEILSHLSNEEILNLNKSQLIDDSVWISYAELNLAKKYPSIYQTLIKNEWGKTFKSTISPFENCEYYLSPIDPLKLYFELENYYTTRYISKFSPYTGYYVGQTETFTYNDDEFKDIISLVKFKNHQLMKLYLCQLTEISNEMIHDWTSRSNSPNEFAEFILCVLLHDRRCQMEYVLKRMIRRGLYDEVINYFDLNHLDISFSNNYILKEALIIHQDYQSIIEAEKQQMEPNYWYESYSPGIYYYCHRKYPTPFINKLLENKSVFDKISEGLLDYLVLTDSQLNVEKAKELLTKPIFNYKKNDIFKYIFESKNEELINLLLANATFKSSLYHYFEKHDIRFQQALKLIDWKTLIKNFTSQFEDINNYLILTDEPINTIKTKEILSNDKSKFIKEEEIIKNILLTDDSDLIDLLLDHPAFILTIIYLVTHESEINYSIREKFNELTAFWRSIL